jgi:hypothetical protein
MGNGEWGMGNGHKARTRDVGFVREMREGREHAERCSSKACFGELAIKRLPLSNPHSSILPFFHSSIPHSPLPIPHYPFPTTPNFHAP